MSVMPYTMTMTIYALERLDGGGLDILGESRWVYWDMDLPGRGNGGSLK